MEKLDYLKSPIGLIKIIEEDGFLISIEFTDQSNNRFSSKSKLLKEATKELKQYFNKERKVFTLPYKLEGTKFIKDIYRTLSNLKYGEVITYKELAELSGYHGAARAVGTAMKNNKLPIIIPCHRVIRSDGKIGQFNAGKDKKKFLLKLEGVRF
ncbi:MAG: methylated-DNA--[protein]-cysteine S-methyltransferase [Halanaerobiales bacterium]|nr:methylated-DNA--[protein]-cysteine S-methyltransferase [Halanaerobiales bacterium]